MMSISIEVPIEAADRRIENTRRHVGESGLHVVARQAEWHLIKTEAPRRACCHVIAHWKVTIAVGITA